jgi:prevent-host-death family protein
MHVWQLQEAKAKLTQLINDTKNSPQIISRHGVNEAIVINIEKYHELCGEKESIVSFFRKSPLYGLDIEFERDKSLPREIDL